MSPAARCSVLHFQAQHGRAGRMRNMPSDYSWESYQQDDSSYYPLTWIAGAATNAPLQAVVVPPNRLLLIPFNQLRDVTIEKIGIWLTTRGGAGAKLRLG